MPDIDPDTLRVLEYVARGRRYVDIEKYPDASARRALGRLYDSQPVPWWECPNSPPCGHAGLFHDIDEPDDPSPTCCVEGCPCGRPVAAGAVGG
jgi:hypothetical protein